MSKSLHYTDRHGKLLKVGQRIRTQVCVGRYGQTAIRQGVIVEFSAYGGATLRTDLSFSEYCGHLGMQHRPVGSLVYVTLPWNGYDRHVDYEHGHETWTEIVEEAAR